MCQGCGCVAFIEQGPEAVLKQAVAVVKELGVTPENAQRYEDGERICHLIGSKLAGGGDREVRETAEWIADLHGRTNAARNEAYTQAARDVFARMPTSIAPREAITNWHQLEQLCRDVSVDALASIDDPAIREAIRAVQHVHDDPQHRVDLIRRYHLEGL